MHKTTAHILKSEEVKLEGRVQLGAPQPGSNLAGTRSGSAVQQARIVENNSEYAVIEVTCCCGTKTYVKCEYDRAKTVGAATTTAEQTN
jgi:hypothetical protein